MPYLAVAGHPRPKYTRLHTHVTTLVAVYPPRRKKTESNLEANSFLGGSFCLPLHARMRGNGKTEVSHKGHRRQDIQWSNWYI